MSPTRPASPPGRRRRLVVVALAAALVAVLAPTVGGAPAGAAPAPLVTEDGIGIRVDEKALTGPALEAIEAQLQPFVDDMIYDGGVDGAPISDYEWLDVSSDVELSVDFLAPSNARPQGGLSVHASIEDIQLEYRADPWWPFSDCSIYVRPDDASITASASVSPALLPGAPLALDPIQATWDDDPSVDYTGVCWYYLIDDLFEGWWDDLVGNDPESTASRIEAQLNAEAQDLIDGLWDDHVVPVIDSLEEFGLGWGQLRTDDHGLIVTADMDASGGLTLPGLPFPIPVGGAEDAGVTADVDDLLESRPPGAGGVIVSIHPNLVNQFMFALQLISGGNLGNTSIPLSQVAALEAALLPASARAGYADAEWYVEFQASSTSFVTPSGPGGAPRLQLPQVELRFMNTGATPVSTFTGQMGNIALVTETRDVVGNWGPAFDASAATLSVTRTQADASAAPHPAASSSTMLPFARTGFDGFGTALVETFVTMGPLQIGDLDIDVCTTCGRYTGDQRYTETFTIS